MIGESLPLLLPQIGPHQPVLSAHILLQFPLDKTYPEYAWPLVRIQPGPPFDF